MFLPFLVYFKTLKMGLAHAHINLVYQGGLIPGRKALTLRSTFAAGLRSLLNETSLMG